MNLELLGKSKKHGYNSLLTAAHLMEEKMYLYSYITTNESICNIHTHQKFTIIKRLTNDKKRIRIHLNLEGRGEIGYVIGGCDDGDDLNVAPSSPPSYYVNRKSYHLAEILVKEQYRKGEYKNLNAGLLLLYLFSMEVKVNHSEYIYISLPSSDALGFYFKYGFYPEPFVVSNFFDGLTLEEKIIQRRSYPRWRGNTQLVCEELHSQIKNHWAFSY